MTQPSSNNELEVGRPASRVAVPVVRVEPETDMAAPEEQRPAANPLLVAHSLLRGRYLWAAALALVGLAGGAAAGYWATHPVYQSQGLISIRPYRQDAMQDQGALMPMYSAYVDAQLAVIRGERVVARAMEKPEWQAIGRGLSRQAVADFSDGLAVENPRSGQLIAIQFNDRDPAAAMTAVKCVIESYRELYGDADTDNRDKFLPMLQEKRVAKVNELKRLEGQIHDVARELPARGLEQVHQFKVDQMNKLEIELRLAELNRAAAGVPATGPSTVPALVPELLATIDPQMRELLARRSGAAQYLKRLSSRMGEDHPSVVEARQGLEDVKAEIDGYMAMLNKANEAGPAGLSGDPRGRAVGVAGRGLFDGVEVLRAKEQNIRRLYEAAKAEATDLGDRANQVQELRAQADAVRTDLEKLKKRLEDLSTDAVSLGRISVLSSGDRPLEPLKDKRRTFAAGGGAGGAAAGVAVVLLFGLLNRRLVFVADAHHEFAHRAPLLGILPDVRAGLTDPAQVGAARHAVHALRTILQLEGGRRGHQVFAVTSPAAGDGKTSVTLALGKSFAAAGSKALLIDCDFVGGGLTAKVRERADMAAAPLLQERAGLTDEQLSQVLAAARADGRPAVDVAVELGHLTRAEAAEFPPQARPAAGFLAALTGRPPAECVVETGTVGLAVLPLGRDDARHLSKLSPAAVRRLLRQVAALYDVVLIDTGPILGSIEAAVAAAEADAVVLAVSRGSRRPMVDRAVERLASIGANTIGAVFNRADMSDLMNSHYGSSGGSMPADRRTGGGRSSRPATDADQSAHLGPIASVLSTTEGSN